MTRPKPMLIITLSFIFFFLIIFVLFLFFKYQQVVVNVNHDQLVTAVTPTATPTLDPNRPFSVLLMGYGGGTHEGGTLTDSIIVAQIIPKEKKIKLISIPRDLWVPIPVAVGETKMTKINEAYSIGLSDKNYPNKEVQFTGKAGGGQMAKSVLSPVVGFTIDNFAVINFNGFLKTIDTLGGIKVNVSKTFDDYYYPIEEKTKDSCGKSLEEITALSATMSGEKLDQQFACRYEQLHFDKGFQTMDSATALKFVRSRHSKEDGGDFNRSARQKLVIESVKNKIISVNFIPKIIPFINSLAGNLTTDINLNKMNEFLSKVDEYKNYEIESFPITDQDLLINSKSSSGQYILIPALGENNWTDIYTFISQPEATTSSQSN